METMALVFDETELFPKMRLPVAGWAFGWSLRLFSGIQAPILSQRAEARDHLRV
jgi:hypothetical protein